MTFTPGALRHRLVLGGVVVGLAFAVVFGAVATWRMHQVEDRAITTALHDRMDLARAEVTPAGAFTEGAGSPKTDLVQIIAPDGRMRGSSPALTGLPQLVDIGMVRSTAQGLQTRVSLQRPDVDLAVLAVPIRMASDGTTPAGTGALVVALDAEGFSTASTDLAGLLMAGLVSVVVAIGALSWVLTGRALRSVTLLTESAEGIHPDHTGTGLPVPSGDAELARLVVALNRMLTRLHQSHAKELAFAADAGHRLRTPVATLRAEAELALRERDPKEITAALERVVQDADQLTSIVDRMLTRSRARQGGQQPVLDALNAASPRWQRQAHLAEVTLSIRVDTQVRAKVSCPDAIEIVEPIVENAVRHTPPGGSIDIDVRTEGLGSDVRTPRMLAISVANTGDPIPAELAPHVFDAWVSSRDASVAGGLGLWLSREAARDQGGDVVLLETDGPRTTFRVVLPCGDAQD